MVSYTRTDVAFSDPDFLWNVDVGEVLSNNITTLINLALGGPFTNPVLTLPDGANVEFVGSFTPDVSGFPTVTLSGTLTGLIFTTGGQTIATVSGFSEPISLSYNTNTSQGTFNVFTLGALFAGNDTLTGGTQNDTFFGFGGNDTISGGTGTNTLDYSDWTTGGIIATIVAGHGTVNKGAGNGIDTLTSIQILNGSPQGDVFYVDSNETVAGGGGFDYLIELSAGVHLTYGTNFTGISEIVSNTGNNVIDATGDANEAFIYGSTGNDTLTLGSGGGFLFGGGGFNILNGGANAANFLIDSGGINTMNGGSGTATNYYYVDGSNDTVHGAGAFNAMIELGASVTVQLGSAQYQDVQEFVADNGSNAVSLANTDTDFVYLYGGAGNDTLSTGAGGGYMIGEGGNNTLHGGAGLNVFVADGASGVDTMNGGSGNNVYFIDGLSTVHGAGTFNTVIELQQNVSLTLGGAQLGSDVEEVVLNGGNNTVDFHTATSPVYLYGGAGNDTLTGGSGGDFLSGGSGTNTFVFQTGWGRDTILDWTAGTNNQIDLTALASLGVHAVSDISQTITNGSDVIVSSHTGTNSITLTGVSSPLSASSFHFA